MCSSSVNPFVGVPKCECCRSWFRTRNTYMKHALLIRNPHSPYELTCFCERYYKPLQVATQDAQIWSWSSNHYIVHGFTKHHNHPTYLGLYNLECKQEHVAHLQKPSASHVTKLAQIPPQRNENNIWGTYVPS